MGIRLVVSGQTRAGKSVVVSDEVIETIKYETDVTPLWAADESPRFPISGERTKCADIFPPLGGYRFMMMSIPPDSQKPTNPPRLSEADTERLGRGMENWMEKDNPGMHTSDTVDLEVVLSGEASLEFDDGVVTHLSAGDCFVQNGTRHRWFNRGNEPAVVAAVTIGGHPRRR
jgi:mannose-6-phosphate isomerase-like protein (cupin superfamily)